MDINIGKRLDGRYELLALIGSGGMADVYKAKDITTGEFVAVKILKKEFSGNEEILRRFRNESKAIAALSHPNIVSIIDVGFTNKLQFIVMEYIDGRTLKECMEEKGVLDFKTSIYYIKQVLRALSHAHEVGIVHRDIKPHNIMVLNDGTIKVMDFGIARFARDEGLTTTAQAIGSVHYISPEQARSDVTDEKSDIYSVGVVLYEMLTGIKPFDGENPVAVALMHMKSEAKKPTDINPDIPKGIEEIILKAMEKQPEDRYATALLMIDDIEKFMSSPDSTFGYYKEEEIYMNEENHKSEKEQNDTNTKFFKTIETEKETEKVTEKVTKKAPKKKKSESVKEVEEQESEDLKDYDEVEYVERRSMFVPILSGVVIVIVIIAVVFIAGLMYNYFGGSGSDNKEFPLTNFVGYEYDYVKKEYGQLLLFEVSEEKYSDSEVNTIIAQDIDPGTIVKPGKKIKVTISKGKKMNEVTPVDSSFTEDQAKSRLVEDGFNVQLKYNYSDTIDQGYVIKTEPEANTPYKEGSTVILYISRGPVVTNVIVPDVVNKKEEEAVKALKDLDLEVEIAQRNSEQPEGTVVTQSQSAGSTVVSGTVITLWISTGQPPTVTQEIEILFPVNANGVFAFRTYVDGTLYSEEGGINSAYTSKKTVSITASGGVKDITVVIVNQENGLEAEIGRYAYSFDEKRSKVIKSENITEAFRSIDGIKVQTVTSSPSVTTTPLVTSAPVTTTEEIIVTEPEESTDPSGESGENGEEYGE